MNDYTGHQIGHYHILRQLGTGAFATVYLAEHLYVEKLAAIKILHLTMEQHTFREFQEEARLNARLEHPHIIHVLDFGFHEQMPYLVMEYALNGTLRTLYPKGSRLPVQQVVTYVSQIAEALDYAHQHKVIHRDVKPENLLLNSQHEIVLSDFGIAVVQRTQSSLSAQQIAGTPLYMAPEQFKGLSLPASDQYALGILVYEWLCGEPPFSGNLFTLAYQHIEHLPHSLHKRMPDISLAVDEEVLRTLAKNPAQRFACVRDFAVALENAVLSTQPTLKKGQFQEKNMDAPAHSPFALDESEKNGQRDNEMGTQSRPTKVQQVQSQQRQMANLGGAIARSEDTIPALSYSAVVVTPDFTETRSSSSVKTSSPSSQPISQNIHRLWLLRRVRSFWITGVLHPSLMGAGFIDVDMRERPDAVANPWKQIVPMPAIPHLPETSKTILQHYHDAGGELLLLGAPGAGKTTLLLMLARDLLTLAEHNESHPVPVIFHLSTWSRKQSLTAWLIDELESKYQVQKKLGQQFVKAHLILPLLDGLDEVAPTERTACVEAINEYRHKQSSSPLVVCSRSVDYLAQEARLMLNNAVMIQPLSMQQATKYLVQGGDALHALHIALQQEASLRELMGTPLLLRMLSLTYYNASVTDILRVSSPSEQIQQVIERYVEHMLARGSDRTRYPAHITKHRLAWLARQMQQRNQKIFYLERIQPDYAEKKVLRQRYPQVMIGLIFGLLVLFGLGPLWADGVLSHYLSQSSMPTSTRVLVAIQALLFALVNGVLFGLVNGALYTRHAEHVSDSPAQQKWRQRGQKIGRGGVNGVLFGLCTGIPFTYISGYTPPFTRILFFPLVLTIGILGGLILFLLDLLLNIRTTEIQPMELVSWSWRSMWGNLAKYLFLGVICDFLIYVAGDYLYRFLNPNTDISTNSPIVVLSSFVLLLVVVVIPFFTLLFAVLKGITSGFPTNVLDPREIVVPNQGIRRSVRYSLLSGLISLCFIVGIPVLLALLFKIPLLLVIMLNVGPLLVLTIMLRIGGIASIQHMVLRWSLRREGVMPWQYSRFLDFAAEHILLQKVGGGYMFVHRFVLEYFASLLENS